MLTLMLLVAAQAAPVPAPKAADKVICRFEQEVYSRIPRRVCMANSEWNRIATEAQEDMRKSANQRGVPPNNQDVGYDKGMGSPF